MIGDLSTIPKRRVLATVATALLLLALGPGCAGRPETRATGLLDLLRRHHEHLRWENYGGAASAVDPAFRTEWAQKASQVGRISEYELGAIELKDPPGDDASVTVRISGFRVPDMTVRTLIVRERWRREGDHWRLTEFEPAVPTPFGQ